MTSYDQWKTGSPADEYGCDDEHCIQCGADLPDPDVGEWADNGFCSPECKADYVAGKPLLIAIRPMLQLLCDELSVDIAAYEDIGARLSNRVYKGTDCGAWLQIDDSTSITVGSIVEGCDFGASPVSISWPFTKDKFWESLQEVEDECKYIWEQTHGCDDCGGGEGEWGHPAINPNCPTCKGHGAII